MTDSKQQAHTAVLTTPTDREIHVERVFDAPRELVFATYTDPGLIPEWWGPRDTTAVVDQMDVRAPVTGNPHTPAERQSRGGGRRKRRRRG